jgi:hypothetical protein
MAREAREPAGFSCLFGLFVWLHETNQMNQINPFRQCR